MKEFILEEELYKVKNPSTREYLKEVVSTYCHEDYRSCIVTLYVITIYDLLSKIAILADVYDVKSAKDFIENYKNETKPGKNTKYSDLEHKIIDEAQKLSIISDIEKRQIEELRALRHDCAHPAISIDSVNPAYLYQPNKDEVRSKIRLMFETIFLKDPNTLKYALNGFEDDIIKYYNTFGENGLENYLIRTYFSRINIEEKKKLLYSPLWYNLFLNNDPKNKTQLDAYRMAMRYLIDSDKESLLSYMKDTPQKFSGDSLKRNLLSDATRAIVSEGFQNRCFILMELLHKYPYFYNGLTDDIKQIINTIAQMNFNLLFRAYYLYNNLEEHATVLLEYMNNNDVTNALQYSEIIKQMYTVAAEKGVVSLYNNVSIIYFTEKQQNIFSSINNAYNIVMSTAIDYMNEAELLTLLNKCTKESSIPNAYCFFDLMIPKISEIAEKNNYTSVLNHKYITTKK